MDLTRYLTYTSPPLPSGITPRRFSEVLLSIVNELATREIQFELLRVTLTPGSSFRQPDLIYRARVDGGWLVLEQIGSSSGICFVPDPNFEWNTDLKWPTPRHGVPRCGTLDPNPLPPQRRVPLEPAPSRTRGSEFSNVLAASRKPPVMPVRGVVGPTRAPGVQDFMACARAGLSAGGLLPKYPTVH